MSVVSVSCSTCGKEFEKPRNEYNRRVRLNKHTRLFCSNQCSGKDPSNLEHIKKVGEPYRGILQPGCYTQGKPLDEYSPFRYFLRIVAKRKTKYGESNLTLEYLKDLYARQNGKCALSGVSLILNPAMNQRKRSISRASLDRINSSVGYVQGNVQFVCQFINLGKNNYSNEEVLELIGQIKHGRVSREAEGA